MDCYQEEERITMRRRIDGERDNGKDIRNEITDVIPTTLGAIAPGETNPMAMDY